MQINEKSDEEILAGLQDHREIEKANIADILLYLSEVQRRKLDLARGYSSLYKFCKVHLSYDKNEAYARISAVNCLHLHPAVEGHLRASRLSLTTLKSANIVFNRVNRARKKSREANLTRAEKISVLERLAAESTRDADRILAELFPRLEADVERTEPIADDRTLISFSASDVLLEKLGKIQDYFAHKNYDRRWERTVELMADEICARIDRERAGPRRKSSSQHKPAAATESSSVRTAPIQDHEVLLEKINDHEYQQVMIFEASLLANSDELPSPPEGKNSRYWSKQNERDVGERSQYQCELVDPVSGRRCDSKHALQCDEIRPIAFGGTNVIENLRMLCDKHNKFTAWKNGLVWRKRVG